MVKKPIMILLALLSTAALAESDQSGFSADSLRERMKQAENNKITASERLKASRSDPHSLKLLKGDEIYFKLPDGILVPGLLLENGKISPAIVMKGGDKVPACVTETNRLIPGRWDGNKKAIFCVLKQNERFALLDNGIKQKTEDGSPGEIQADKYGSTSPTNPENQQSPEADKYGNPQRKTRTASNQSPSNNPSANKYGNSGGSPKSQVEHSPYIYKPPNINSSGNKTVGVVLEQDTKKFGIPVGTWIKAELMRPASTAERGRIEFEVKETVFGRYRDLPENTILFANKYINEAEERMEATTILARLPDGQEIKVEATVHSLNRTAGLSGSLVRDREGEIVSASSNAVASAINNTVPILEGSTGSAVAGLAGDLINTESKYLPNKPQPIIRVASQTCLLKITKTF